jgi:hypothetical protein
MTMEESPSSSEHLPLEGDLWSRYPKTYDDVVARSGEVDLSEHLSAEDIARLSQEASSLGLPDADQFLRSQVVRLSDILEADETVQQVEPVDFITQVLSAASDGVYG